MKNSLLITAMIGLACWVAGAQTSDEWIAQGRVDLANQDLADANTAFAEAVVLSPTNEIANACYAVTRLLVLPSQPEGSNFLSRIGFAANGRNIYDWTSSVPKDTNGLVLAPTGVNAADFVAQLRTNVLLAVAGAISNLNVITDTNFTLDLTSNETAIASVTVDYGDIKLIQAGLYGAEYLIYTLNAQDLNAQLTDIRALYTGGLLSASQMLARYPQLFTFATTNDLQAAQAAFVNGVNSYMIASKFIRSRPTNEVRLFNYDQVQASSEGDFRLTLQDLENSLVLGPQWLAVDSDLAVDATPQFAGDTSWRSLLPKFEGNAIELGSFPDLTFDGVIYGLTEDQVEGALNHSFVMLPVGAAPEFSASNTVRLAFTTLSGHAYTLEVSSDLVNWQGVTNFAASGSVSLLVDAPMPFRRFYRLRDDADFLAFAGLVVDQTTGLPIAGAQVQSLDDGTTTYTDANGGFCLLTTLPTSWGGSDLQISAPGYGAVDTFYSGYGCVSGLQIALLP